MMAPPEYAEVRAGEDEMAGNRRRRSHADVAAALKSRGGRLVRALGTTLLILGGIAGTAEGGRRGYLWVTTSPTFAIKSIVVRGNRRASGQELMRVSGLALGHNVFVSDVDSAAAGVLGSPWVRSAVVQRHLPDSMSIEVVEREPRLVVALDSLYLADGDGVLFKRVGQGDDLDLPVVTGVSRAGFAHKPAEVEGQLREVLALVSEYAERGLSAKAGDIEELMLDDDGVTLTLGKAAVTVQLGEAPFDEKLDKLDTLYGEFARRGIHPAVVHLENRAAPDRVAVKLADASVAGATKSANPVH